MKILVFILAALGDTLFTTPSLKALRRGYPEAEIEAICWEENKDILSGNKNIDNLLVCQGKGQLISELQNLRDTRYDLAIGLSTVGSYISYLVNARIKLGFKGKELGWIYDLDVPDNRRIHAVDYCLEIVKTVGAEPEEAPRMELPFTDADVNSLKNKLYKQGINPGLPLLAVHPGGKYFTTKRWPQYKFKELLKTLDRMYNIQLVIIGGPDDRLLAGRIIDRFYDYRQRPAVLAGQLKIKETAALLRETALFIGNDSAPLHMAAAVGTTVIGLFGPTNLANFYPYGTNYRIARAEAPCMPCFSWLGELKQYIPEYLPDWANKCKLKCMDEIEVEDVTGLVSRLIPEILPVLSREEEVIK